jgi:hypothetical protein
MTYLFAIPLVLGALPQAIMLKFPKLHVGGSWQKIMHNFAIATLAVGSLLQGVMEIYGTSSPYIVYYLIIGALLLLVSALMWINIYVKKHRRKRR